MYFTTMEDCHPYPSVRYIITMANIPILLVCLLIPAFNFQYYNTSTGIDAHLSISFYANIVISQTVFLALKIFIVNDLQYSVQVRLGIG